MVTEPPENRTMPPSAVPDWDTVLPRLETVARAILRHKSGMSLRPEDTRHDNVEALELLQEVMARLWERLVNDDGREAIEHLQAYAASVTHHAWADHLRRRHPQRASLKNRLRYFLGHQAAFALWPGDNGTVMTGLHGWRLAPPKATDAGERTLAALRNGTAVLPRGSVPRKDLDRIEAADWARLLDALYRQLMQPVELDELTSLVAGWLDLREPQTESLDGEDDDAPVDEPADTTTPERIAEVRSLLRQLWGAILALKWDYRCAYLLNLPGADKTRGDLEVFLMHGIAGLHDIEAALALGEAHYRSAFAALALPEAERPPPDAQPAHCFRALWPCLPLADAVIGAVLELAQQQVINRRMLALRELSRAMGHDLRRRSSA